MKGQTMIYLNKLRPDNVTEPVMKEKCFRRKTSLNRTMLAVEGGNGDD